MYRAYFFAKAVSFWGLLLTGYRAMVSWVSHGIRWLYQATSGTTESWVFLKGHTLPLPVGQVRYGSPIWSFGSSLLRFLTQERTTVHRLSWLSARIHVIEEGIDQEFDMDPFLESFRVDTTESHCPTLTMIWLCWCAQQRRWFSPNALVQFQVITHEGQEEILSVKVDSLKAREGKLYPVVSPQEYPNAYTYYHA